jgi:hypothetical protein
MTAMTVNIWFTPHKNLVEKVKLTKLPMACLIASTTHQDKEWSIAPGIFHNTPGIYFYFAF